jgi:hypothetical protein
MLLSEICGLVSMGRLLWREDGSAVCSVITLEVEVEVRSSLRLTVSRSVCLGIEYPCGTSNQILFPVGMLLSEICGLLSMGRPLWREDGSAVCSVITLEVEVEVRSSLRLTVSQYVLVSSTHVGLATRYYFLSECCCLKFAVLYLWGALSDERTGLQFAV